MRTAELIYGWVSEARDGSPNGWQVAVSREVHEQLMAELDLPWVDQINGVKVVVGGFEEPDLVMLIPRATTHVFSSEEALLLSTMLDAVSKVRAHFVPPVPLDTAQQEVYDTLRHDGMQRARAAEVAQLI